MVLIASLLSYVYCTFLVKAFMDEDERLRQLIATVCERPKGSREWHKALNQLLSDIQNLPKLERSNHPEYPEVVNDTLLLVGEKIQEFQPSSSSSISNSLAAWINYKLRHYYRVRELYQNAPTNSISIDHQTSTEVGSRDLAKSLSDPYPSTIWELEDEIQQWQQQQTIESIGKNVWQYIEQDPEGKLRNCHPRKCPECNCQLLSQRLLLKNPPDKLADIVREYGVNDQTLRSHWRLKGIPLLQEIATELKYQSNLINSHE